MKQSTSTLVFLGLITYSQAIRLPDYWDGEYSNTWFYAGRDHIVNAEEWKEGDPCGYKGAVWGHGTECGSTATLLQTEDDNDFSEITQVQIGDVVLNLAQRQKKYDHLDEQHSTVVDTGK